MTRKQIPIFATQNDLSEVLIEVSMQKQLSFVDSGLFDQALPSIFNDVKNIQPFRTYLAFDRGASIETRKVPQRDGSMRYAVQLDSIHGVSIYSGALIEGRRLLAGQIAPFGEEVSSSEIYALIAKVVRSRFEKIKSFYVGPEAVQLLESGVRLAPTAKSPEIYDLARS